MVHTDVLVVGGGPAGASVATWLARAGHGVILLEKRPVPRHKACGDALTPRAVTELARLDIDPVALGGHRVAGVRMVHGGRTLDVRWPDHPDFASHGAVVRRDVLDAQLRRGAASAGATVLMGHEATAPIVERGFVRGAVVDQHPGGTREVRARFVVVADGANSSFGRALGTTRDRNWPYGISTRSYWASSRSDDAWIEASPGLPDAHGTPIAGFGWVIPVGDGTVNVGVGILSTYRDVRGVNALKLLDSFAERISDRWQIEPGRSLKAPTRFRVPLGGSVGPKMGPTFLVTGDAAGAANPFDGAGVDTALASGRVAAEVLVEALTTGNSTTLQRYPTILEEQTGQYYKVGRLTARFLGRPAILRAGLAVGMRSNAVMGSALRVATGQLRAGERGGAERGYALASAISRFAPNW